jgi:hypothetical protein
VENGLWRDLTAGVEGQGALALFRYAFGYEESQKLVAAHLILGDKNLNLFSLRHRKNASMSRYIVGHELATLAKRVAADLVEMESQPDMKWPKIVPLPDKVEELSREAAREKPIIYRIQKEEPGPKEGSFGLGVPFNNPKPSKRPLSAQDEKPLEWSRPRLGH